MKRVWGLMSLVVVGMTLSACDTTSVDASKTASVAEDIAIVDTGSTVVKTDINTTETAERGEIVPLVDDYPGYYMDGVDIYWNMAPNISNDPKYKKVDGVAMSAVSLLSTGAVVGCRGTICNRQWLVSDDAMWFEGLFVDVDVSTFRVRSDLSCQDTTTLAEDKINIYLINNQNAIIHSRPQESVVIDADNKGFNWFTTLYDRSTGDLYVFFAIESAPRAGCQYVVIPNVSDQFVWTVDTEAYPSIVFVKDGEKTYRVESDGYNEVIE